MSENSKDIQLQYQGFLKTPLLWLNYATIQLEQFTTSQKKTTLFNSNRKLEIRLGKRVEQFCFEEIKQDDSVRLISENLQIQDGKRTVGEIDCLIIKNQQPIHIEIVYKFYLYDKSVGKTEIEHWIGPNRRDSFYQKLTKLKNKQLPLLQNKHTEKYLETLGLDSEKIIQKVYFKAQLFVPLKDLNSTFPEINNDCISGFYIYFKELAEYKNCKFHIPSKLNWLQEPHLNVSWQNFEEFESKINIFHFQKSAPLCWLKKPNGEIKKIFIVWW